AQQALALARQRGERGYEALALRLHGDIAARREPLKVEHAGESYRQALALASELGMQPIMAHCHRALGLLYQRANKGGADDHLGRAALLYRTLGMSF
ncbi:MAG TPA: transcriptional regulator, SARP family protein, partial [Candidatus Methylomirabilis sp.]|nr:transcriptional regulator, SARP family protein [Candidatus Methylomirabilis sp.]